MAVAMAARWPVAADFFRLRLHSVDAVDFQNILSVV